MKDFFDRKTFDPVGNPIDRQTLTVLRTQGRSRLAKFQKDVSVRSTAMKWALEVVDSGKVDVWKVNPNRNLTFLDLGCGDSPDALLANNLGCDSYGLDLFPPEHPTDNGRLYVNGATANFIQADVAENIPFPDDSIDVVVSQAMMDLIEPVARERFHREVRRVLKDDGVFACYLQWLQTGYGFDLEEEQLRAEEIWGKIERKAQGFIALKF